MCGRGSDSEDYKSVCNMAAAMARACAKRGIEVDWLANNTLYAMCTDELCKLSGYVSNININP